MRGSLSVATLVVALSFPGCARPGSQQPAQEVREGAERAADRVKQGAQGLADSLKQMAEDLSKMTGDERKPVEPLDFRDLWKRLPEIEGWTKGSPKGERMSSPVTFSRAEVTYRKDTATVEAKIVDTGLNRIILAPVALLLKTGLEREDELSYQRTTTVDGFPAWETWDRREGKAELNLIVDNRFLLTLEGTQLETADILKQIASKAELTKLTVTPDGSSPE